MKLSHKLVGGLLAASIALGSAWGASLPQVTGVQELNQLTGIINTLINSINALVTPNSMAVYATPRNYVDNGAMNVAQRGTGIRTCTVNAGVASVNYGADRWACSANVAVGAARMQVITVTPSPPTGFTQSQKLYRTSGALLQPVCAIQEIPSTRAVDLQGQYVTLSIYGQALAGFSAASNLVSATVIYGTGTDEGLGTWTASPAVTPAWTGIGSLAAGSFNLTTAWVRYTGSPVLVPATATEIGVELCFTPVGSGSGTTDGFAFTGVQLEQGLTASPFEYRAYGEELRQAQRYFYNITESATVIGQRALCAISTTSLAVCQIKFPVMMRVAPTMTYTSGFALTGSAQTGANVCAVTRTSTTLTSAAATTEAVPIDCTSSAAFGAAGTAAQLYDLGTGSATGVINASADF